MKKSNITYTEINGILYPNLKLENETNYNIGKYGSLHENFIKNNKRELWFSLTANGELNEYLHNIDISAHEMLDQLMESYIKQYNITEELKQTNQLEWVRLMNMANLMAEEVIFNEIVCPSQAKL
ncbi:TnpV protein [Clostridium algidicarnis]|uniref:Transposon-encoded protein TnpV n=1 Tax=Clostridium algidicarnis DSM 15099 TaxID=1121295 RepID=A0A2S6FUQ7_9CLOT|nr:TnpV protein [Clostridium algidicarnis]PPK44392.1 transposon-encoded protein TnpV [Clostridium algidicarnis DSM 15099]